MVARKDTKKVMKSAKKEHPLFPSRPKNFGVGQDVLPKKRDLGRYVKWPKYVRLQRQRKILMQRLKVPPSIAQFNNTLEKTHALELFKVMASYRPETKKDKKERLKAAAEKKAAGETETSKPGPVLKFGLHHVTTLIEEKKAKLVIIAADVNPLELVVWMPALCRKMDIPYCIVNNKGRLGTLVHQRNATCLAITEVGKEHEGKLSTLQDICRAQFNDNKDALKKWGGGIMGLRTQTKLAKRAAAVEAEERKKQKMLG
ncbi:60S ribosomal protein L7a [Hondaea fermentalgiana]|uniref:60S ribosomal protein L7a n=1 Tax=Hondaea fermentalgiana TaxID=2315210 RepID=A0A2R5GF54_9STRA|nr:60S ribosomal protein L7a [Hondaea fermentalgiana]|eukprot:GBG26464.1 60S ribosomal protein L7a [Hondaea fermentalgiana]